MHDTAAALPCPVLELRPNCELCDVDLPPSCGVARICTYECTFCASCVDEVLRNVCPNCGGAFASRPVRPAAEHRPGLGLKHHPASDTRVHTKRSRAEIEAFAATLAGVQPGER